MIHPEAIVDASQELERRIDYQAWLMVSAITDAEKTSAWQELKRLHAQRTPERVAQMEREAGLR